MPVEQPARSTCAGRFGVRSPEFVWVARRDLFVCSFLQVGAWRCVLPEAVVAIKGAVNALLHTSDKTRFLFMQYALFRGYLPCNGVSGCAQ
jgi:hypothetical protein